MEKVLMKGNEAIAESAIRAGGLCYFCYPLTPQSEVAEYLARRMPEVGGAYLQAESEVAVANMVYGAAGAGARAWTTSSSPGISLMMEGISYIAAAELPAVIVNIVRAGPGLGGILPSQGDYRQAVKSGGHGDYRCLVLAPSSVQEAVDLMPLAFDRADRYRGPVMVVGDGMIGQMMEPVEFKEWSFPPLPPKGWATTGAKGRKPNVVNSLHLDAAVEEQLNITLAAKYEKMKREEVRFEEYNTDKPYRVLLVAYGTTARICKTAIAQLAGPSACCRSRCRWARWSRTWSAPWVTTNRSTSSGGPAASCRRRKKSSPRSSPTSTEASHEDPFQATRIPD